MGKEAENETWAIWFWGIVFGWAAIVLGKFWALLKVLGLFALVVNIFKAMEREVKFWAGVDGPILKRAVEPEVSRSRSGREPSEADRSSGAESMAERSEPDVPTDTVAARPEGEGGALESTPLEHTGDDPVEPSASARKLEEPPSVSEELKEPPVAATILSDPARTETSKTRESDLKPIVSPSITPSRVDHVVQDEEDKKSSSLVAPSLPPVPRVPALPAATEQRKTDPSVVSPAQNAAEKRLPRKRIIIVVRANNIKS